ncbi:MAG TPA: VCBS repeat-containing protein [Cyclobacteriaceae bacterium]|nr:VCBS repeat-containing protein [Cyclobacteriaceae bacterium]
MKSSSVVIALALVWLVSCAPPEQESKKSQPKLFEQVPSSWTGIDVINQLDYTDEFNIYKYRNFYNGGGVALGDINNDGLVDVYFTLNMRPNRLFLNKGNFKFEDITDRAGVAGKGAWSTGVSMADVNGDGWLDIYVCNSGDIKGDNKQNELFINNGDMTFTERAAQYGVDDRGYTTHAAFFDYDKDGDLDLYILNNSFQAIGSFNLRKSERGKRDVMGGHKLLRNDGNRFTDVSEKAGIYGSVIAFGLGVTVGDINKDGWQDIYVSNDFFERDYLYINNHNGTFHECLPDQMKSISGASMGADLADMNNDTYPDIFVTEMLPEGNDRIKTVTTFENWDRYQYGVTNGYYHQFTRNMLQLNNGDNTFSEIGRLCEVESTDWSWGALIFDMDNDGNKDIFVANGIFHDLTDQDYLQFASSEEVVKAVTSGQKVDYRKLIEAIPSNRQPNYAFANQGDLMFSNKAVDWGLAEPSFSNGSAYGDLDNDGDLDLIVNNVNMEAFVYRNHSDTVLQHHYLKFVLEGEGKNTYAFGTKITLKGGGKKFYLEQMPIRGFESSVDTRPNFGLGDLKTVDSVLVEWPNGAKNILTQVATDQTIRLKQADGKTLPASTAGVFEPWLEMSNAQAIGLSYRHLENEFVDFDRDRLIYHMMSSEGPRMSVADVNGDGLEDLYIGGARDQSGSLYMQLTGGRWKLSSQPAFEADKISEDTGSAFFDADGDGDMDLYVCSGGNEFLSISTALIDRLYLNDGKGNFSKSQQILPTSVFENTSTVRANDVDGDGDQDLFVGVRLDPSRYGVPVNGYLLINDGHGNFTNQSDKLAPGLKGIGMITDNQWADVDGDKDADLVLVGDWMAVTILYNDGGKLATHDNTVGLSGSQGWWNRLVAGDLDGDGDIDFVAGNHGLNSRFKASSEKPVRMVVNDFDQNGTWEQIISTYNGEKSYPMALRHDLLQQMPMLKKKYLKYASYRDQTIADIFTEAQMKGAVEQQSTTLATSVIINEGGGRFTVKALPTEAQLSPVYGIIIRDLNKDGKPDILLGGNLYKAKPEVGRYDASYGMLLRGDGKGGFEAIPNRISGISLDGEVRDIVTLSTGLMVISRNNDMVQLIKQR